MKISSQRAPFFLGAAAALMLTFSTAAVYPQLGQTGDSTPTPAARSTDAAPSSSPVDVKGMGRFGMGEDHQALLAEALGISVEELQAAHLATANAALDQAVEQDLLTQTQADNLRQRLESAGGNGFGFRFGGRALGMLGSDTIDTEALLADALGITVEELQAAYDDAQAAALAQAVEDGQLTQEQADLMAARQAFRAYVQTQQQGYAELVQAALDAGAITQVQADLLLANQPAFGERGFGMGRGFDGDFGRGMRGGHGGGRGLHGGLNFGSPDGSQPVQPEDGDAQSNSGFLLPSAGL